MTVIKLALAAAALGATAHPTPKVVLVKHADFIRQTIPSARRYFVRTVTIGKEDLAAIRKASDFTPDDPDVQFFLGQDEGGATVETKPWVQEAAASGLMKGFVGMRQGDDPGKALQSVDGLGGMPQYMAELIVTAVGRGLVLYGTLYRESAS